MSLRALGIRKGDRIAIYLPLIPELAIAMLACARIGAVHSVVFGGFSAESLRDRINDQQARLLITADGGYRRGNVVQLKRVADEALQATPSIEHVIVVQRRINSPFTAEFSEGRDLWYHDLMKKAPVECEPEPMDAEDMLYILYTSGTTGKPKGIVHTTGGYLTGCYATTKWVFDLKEEDVYWCTADIGWVTGHSYVVYGPLANGATVVMYEGAPDFPQKDRFWEIVERYGVTVFYTAPTAIRAFMKWGPDWPERHDLSSLRVLGSVGEPINPEAWMWYHLYIGHERCPIVDTWWQTETGHILITPLPGLTRTKPGSATQPFPGIIAEIRRDDGSAVDVGGGFLALTKPWPGMLRGIYGDMERYEKQVLEPLDPGRLLHRRRRQARRGRLPVAARPGGRRAERRGPSHRDHGSRERAGGPPEGRRIGRGGSRPRHQGPGRRRFRHRQGRRDWQPRTGRGAAAARREEDWRHCQTRRHHLRRRSPEDPIGQDHAPPVAGYC